MVKIDFVITFHSFWHTGNIPGDIIDSLTNKVEGLPVFPNDTFQGILKESARWLENQNKLTKKDFCNVIFGRPDAEYHERALVKFSGDLSFRDFTLADVDVDLNKAIEITQKVLYQDFDFTAIDCSTGSALENTLRKIEYAIPLSLFGSIEIDKDYLPDLKICFAFIKEVGSNSTRGFGKCTIKFIEDARAER